MRKILALVLSTMMALTLTACSQSQPAATTAAPAPAATTAAAAPAAPAAAPAETTAATASSSFTPPSSIEFICCYGAGGGHDTMLRAMEAAWRANNIYNGTITYNYQNGGAQAVGMTYTLAQRGRNDCLMSTTAQLIKTPMTNDLGFDWHDFNPLILWGEQCTFMVVRSDLGVDSVDELMKSGKSLTFANTGAGTSGDYITIRLQQIYPDADLVGVSFDGDGEILTQLLGGHVDATFTDLGSVRDYIEEVGGTGELKILAVCNEERSSYMPDIPTLTEQGIDIVSYAIRGIVAPPDMDQEYIDYYTDICLQLLDTPEFKKYYEDNTLEFKPLVGDELIKYLEDMEAWQIESYKAAGIEILDKYNK